MLIKRISGVILVVMAVLVVAQTIGEPLYHVSEEAGAYSRMIWDTLNPLMLLTIVLGVIFAHIRKRDLAVEDGNRMITREFITANTQFYGFLFMGILFCWNWFNTLTPGFSAVGADPRNLVWLLINATLPLLAGSMGIYLLRQGKDG